MKDHLKKAKPKLLVDWCSHKAATFACENWHYSKKMTAGKVSCLGVWESGRFIGSIVFGQSAAPQRGDPYGLKPTEVAELLRVALKNHVNEVTKIIAISIKMIKKKCPKLKLLVSYADPEQGHKGVIYKAGNWIFNGYSQSKWTVKGIHNRAFDGSLVKARKRFGNNVKIDRHKPKIKFIYPLTKELTIKLKCATSIENDATNLPVSKGECDSYRGAPKKGVSSHGET